MSEPICGWYSESYDDAELPVSGEPCGAPASWVSCVPYTGVRTCEAHKCRCATPLARPDPTGTAKPKTILTAHAKPDKWGRAQASSADTHVDLETGVRTELSAESRAMLEAGIASAKHGEIAPLSWPDHAAADLVAEMRDELARTKRLLDKAVYVLALVADIGCNSAHKCGSDPWGHCRPCLAKRLLTEIRVGPPASPSDIIEGIQRKDLGRE